MDAATGEQFFNDPLATPNLCAPGSNTSTCYPRLIEGNTAIVATLTPNAAFTQTDVMVGYQGFLIRGFN